MPIQTDGDGDHTMNALVPFGKYKGQPVELMLSDIEYCNWVMAQSWFRERFPTIVNVIVNRGSADDQETPEHNVLQAMFLEGDVCEKLANFLGLVDPKHDISYFEVGGWDVIVYVRNLKTRKERISLGWKEDGNQEFKYEPRKETATDTIAIECKPIVGDDYPAILRKMKTYTMPSNRRRDIDFKVLITKVFQSSVPIGSVRKMFEASGINLMLFSDIT
jgi:hypothetical protein